MNKRNKILMVVTGVAIVAFSIWFFMVPDVRHRPLTEREHLLINQGRRTTHLFEMGRGSYQLHLYHYSFGDLIATEEWGSIWISDRTGMVAFYSTIDDNARVSLGMTAPGWSIFEMFSLELEDFPSWSIGPRHERISQVSGEQVFMSYQFDTSGSMLVVHNPNFQGFGEHIADFAQVEHIILITIRSSD